MTTQTITRYDRAHPIQTHEWWSIQALAYHGRECPRCTGLTRGEYVAPNDRLGECGVVEHCPICGWERCHLTGRHGRVVR